MLENELCFPRSTLPERTKAMTVEFPSFVVEQHASFPARLQKLIASLEQTAERVSKPRSWPRLNTIKRAPKATVRHQVTYLKVNSQSQKIFLFTT